MFRNRRSRMVVRNPAPSSICGKEGKVVLPHEDVEKTFELPGFSRNFPTHGRFFSSESRPWPSPVRIPVTSLAPSRSSLYSRSSPDFSANALHRLAELGVHAHRILDFANRVDHSRVITVPEELTYMYEGVVQ